MLSVEKATAKMNTVKIRLMEVRGTMVAGRRVSWAACEMDSSPTKEMMASEEPYMKRSRVGASMTHWRISSSGSPGQHKAQDHDDRPRWRCRQRRRSR